MARTTWRKDTEADDVPPASYPQESACQLCIKSDANLTREAAMQRLSHYLEMARDYGCDALRSHLAEYLGLWYATNPDKAKEVAQSHMGWVWDQINTYGGLVDDQTGATLSWYDGRKQALAAIRDYYARTSEAARAKSEAAETSAWPTTERQTVSTSEAYAGIAGQVPFSDDDGQQWLDADVVGDNQASTWEKRSKED